MMSRDRFPVFCKSVKSRITHPFASQPSGQVCSLWLSRLNPKVTSFPWNWCWWLMYLLLSLHQGSFLKRGQPPREGAKSVDSLSKKEKTEENWREYWDSRHLLSNMEGKGEEGRGKERKSISHCFHQLLCLLHPLHIPHYLVFDFPSIPSPWKHQCVDFRLPMADSQTAWLSIFSYLLDSGLAVGHCDLSVARIQWVLMGQKLSTLLLSACLPLWSFLFSLNYIMIVWVFIYKDGALGLSFVRWCTLSSFPSNLSHVH